MSLVKKTNKILSLTCLWCPYYAQITLRPSGRKVEKRVKVRALSLPELEAGTGSGGKSLGPFHILCIFYPFFKLYVRPGNTKTPSVYASHPSTWRSYKEQVNGRLTFKKQIIWKKKKKRRENSQLPPITVYTCIRWSFSALDGGNPHLLLPRFSHL